METDEHRSGPMRRAVDRSIAGLAPTERVPKHAALALLAVQYAEVLDANEGDADVLLDFGPKLQSALLALGCAPAKTAKSPDGGESNGSPRASALATLRAARGASSRAS